MSIEDAIKRALEGDFGPQLATPLSDEAFAVLKGVLPYQEKLQLVCQLMERAEQVGGEDLRRFGHVIECIYADASAEELLVLQSDHAWPE
jgi:hypothetical protein